MAAPPFQRPVFSNYCNCGSLALVDVISAMDLQLLTDLRRARERISNPKTALES
jgi:hypothetical protein